MIEFRYRRDKVSDDQAQVLGEELDAALRTALKKVRPERDSFKITVEGDPFGPITLNQPDLRIYIFYHVEWKFTRAERTKLAASTSESLKLILRDLSCSTVSFHLRFYSRIGHEGVSFS